MKNKITVSIMTIVIIASFLVGCAKTRDTANVIDMTEKKEQEVEQDLSESSELENNEEKKMQETEESVYNAEYFVMVNNKIYFRSYPIGTLETPLQGTDFVSGGMGEKSNVMCFDMKTKETTIAFSDNGQGAICYLDGRFYFEDCQGGMCSCKMDGSDVKRFETDESLSFLGCDLDSHTIIVKAYTTEGDEKIEVWNDGEYMVDLGENPYVKNAAVTDYFSIDDEGSLVRNNLEGQVMCVPNFTENLYNKVEMDVVELQNFIGEYAYLVVNTLHNNAETNEDSKYLYTRVATRYLQVNLETNEIIEMDSVR